MTTLLIRKLLVLIATLSLSANAWGLVFEVTNAEEFQAALAATGDSGSDNTIMLRGNSFDGNFRFNAKNSGNLEILSDPGEAPLIDADNQAYGLFIDLREASYTIKISNLRITRGFSRLDGGGLFIAANKDFPSQVILKDISITNSAADYFGGGLAAHGLHSIQIEESAFEGNTAKRGGGGVSIESKTATLSDLRINENEVRPSPFPGFNGTLPYCYPISAFQGASPEADKVNGSNGNPSPQGGGGGLLLWEGKYQLKDSEITSNNIRCFGGGAAAIAALGELSILRSTIANNQGSYSLGGFSASEQDVHRTIPLIDAARAGSSIRESVITNNKFQLSFANLTPIRRTIHLGDSALVENTEFRANTHIDDAGHVVSEVDESRSTFVWIGSNSSVATSSFIENSGTSLEAKHGASIHGNVVSNQGGTAILANNSSSLINNTVVGRENAVEIYPEDGDVVELRNNIIKNLTDSEASSVYIDNFSDLFGTGFEASASNNIWENVTYDFDEETSNSDLDPRFVSIESNDFHLMSSSPAIDSGDNSVLSIIGNQDLEGNPRLVDGVVDVGAHERFTGTLHPADTDGNSSISRAEFDAYNAAWRTNEPWPNPPASIEADYVTRAGYLLQKGGAYKNIGVGKPATWVPANED